MHQALHRPDRHPVPPSFQRLGFIELTTDEPDQMAEILSRLGFSAAGAHRTRPATLFRQGAIHILVSSDRAGYARQFRNLHSTSACAYALQVDDAPAALEYAEYAGAHRYRKNLANELDVNIPALVGPGQTLVYLMDDFAEDVFQQLEFKPASNDDKFSGDCGLVSIEQITLQVGHEFADSCLRFYRHALCLQQSKDCLPPWMNIEESGRCLAVGGGHDCIDFRLTSETDQAGTGQIAVIHLSTADLSASVQRLLAQDIAFAEPDGQPPETGSSAGAAGRFIQKVFTPRDKGQRPLFRARTLPILGNISIELVEKREPG